MEIGMSIYFNNNNNKKNQTTEIQLFSDPLKQLNFPFE